MLVISGIFLFTSKDTGYLGNLIKGIFSNLLKGIEDTFLFTSRDIGYLYRIQALLISLSNVAIYPKMANCLFSAKFFGNVCCHSNGKSKINSRLLHFDYCSKKLLRKKLVKKQILIFSVIGGRVAK